MRPAMRRSGVDRGSVTRFVALSAIWGSSFLFIKEALEGLAPAQIVLGRLLAGAIVLAIAVAARHGTWPRGGGAGGRGAGADRAGAPARRRDRAGHRGGGAPRNVAAGRAHVGPSRRPRRRG